MIIDGMVIRRGVKKLHTRGTHRFCYVVTYSNRDVQRTGRNGRQDETGHVTRCMLLSSPSPRVVYARTVVRTRTHAPPVRVRPRAYIQWL